MGCVCRCGSWSNATSPDLLRAFAKFNAGKAYSDQVKPFNFLSFAPGAQPPADQHPERFRLVAPYGTAAQRRNVEWVNIHEPGRTYRLQTDRTRPGTAIADSHRLHALRYFSHIESKSADQDHQMCGRGTEGLLQRRQVTAQVIANIGKEANRLDQRESGELTTYLANDVLLVYNALSVDTWHSEDLPQLRQLPLKQVAAAGLSGPRLRDIYDARSKPRKATKERLRRAISELLPET